ncbi:hypothetical protein JCM14469_32770 [Desulfatiferula olefinivorans]
MKLRHGKKLGAMALGVLLCCGGGKTALASDGHWYKGDLHAHSLHSDGDSPVADVVSMAESLGFDFFALTDHDGNMNGVPTHWADPDYRSETMTLLYGVEWTTGKGHANVWAAAPFDYTPLWNANIDENAAAAVSAAHNAGALFSINHPTAYLCCPWEYPVDESVDAMEVWNSMYRIPNMNGLAVNTVWDHVLMSGRKLSCVGGSDTHELKGIQSGLFGLGNPTTWVYAKDRSAQAILEGIKAGRTTLSYAPDGPRVTFTADRDNDGVYETLTGDNITGGFQNTTFRIDVIEQAIDGDTGRTWELDDQGLNDLMTGAFWLNGSLKRLNVDARLWDIRVLAAVKNGTLFKAWITTGDAPAVTFTDKPGDLDYYRVVLYGRPELDNPFTMILYGRLLALTGPIYSGFHSDDENSGMNMYFGNLHSHTAVSDGQGTPAEAFAWARDEAGYDFYAITDHAEQILLSEWRETGRQADAFNEKGRFVAMRGFEWSHPLAGHINVYNTSSFTNAILSPSLDIFYNWLDRKNGLAHFNHPGRELLVFRNFAFKPHVADNFFAMETGNKDTGNADGEYLNYFTTALSAGWHVAPTNNQDNHSLSTNSHRTVIIAPELSRAALLAAMKDRRIYSTDDPTIKVVFKLDDAWMGSRVETAAETVTFTIDITDDETIEKIELLNSAGETVAEKVPDLPTDSIRWCPQIPAVSDAYYVKITSENWYDNALAEPVQITVTAPISLN